MAARNTTKEPAMQTIEVGTRVRVRTLNGGEMVGTVSSRYVETYALELLEAHFSILAHRIVDVVVLDGRAG